MTNTSKSKSQREGFGLYIAGSEGPEHVGTFETYREAETAAGEDARITAAASASINSHGTGNVLAAWRDGVRIA